MKQECGKPGCPFYGQSDEPGSPAEVCPDDHILDRHPASDGPDWLPSNYTYRDNRFELIATLQDPIDDESALARFHILAKEFPDVTYVIKQDPGKQKEPGKMLPYKFSNGSVEKM